jgi:lipoyl(octanoyl) transferase
MAAARARLLHLGLRPYREAWALQRELHARVAAGEEPDTWLVVEHAPVVTLGRNTKREHLLVSPEALAARGVDCVEVERGGDVTYHGPGQLVVYPILKLPRFREVAPLVTALEESVIAAVRNFGVIARGRREHRGVYVGENALCAIGLSIRAMTSLHGLALNVRTNLDYTQLITPCGTPHFGVTSLSQEIGRQVRLDEVTPFLLNALADRFAITFETTSFPSSQRLVS